MSSTSEQRETARRALVPRRWRLQEHWRGLLAELVIIAVGVGVALRGLLPLEARLDLRVIADDPDPIDAQVVAAELRRREALVAILEDSIWTQMRVQFGANELLGAIAELEGMLARQAE